MHPTEMNTTHREVIRSAGCDQAAANSGCSTCSMAVSATDVTAANMLIQQNPVTARSRISGGSLDATGLGLSSASEDMRWIRIITYLLCWIAANRLSTPTITFLSVRVLT